MTINQRIFKILDEKHLKQADLARILNVRTSVIASWKTRGSNPPIEYAAQICEFLNITIYELLDIKNDNEIEILYKKLEPKDREIVDNIFNRYREQKSSSSMIG